MEFRNQMKMFNSLSIKQNRMKYIEITMSNDQLIYNT